MEKIVSLLLKSGHLDRYEVRYLAAMERLIIEALADGTIKLLCREDLENLVIIGRKILERFSA